MRDRPAVAVPSDDQAHIVRLNTVRINRRKVGPYSRAHLLSSVDCRSQIGRYIRDLAAELAAHVGGDPTPAQRVLIKEAAIKSARLGMLVDKIFSSAELDFDLATRVYLAWSNSLRRDLEALGLNRPEQRVPGVADFLAARKKSA
jgi:hypothetical protein